MDGKLTTLDGRIAGPSVTSQTTQKMAGLKVTPADRTVTEGSHDQPYATANYRISGHVADLTVPVGFWRSVGNSQNGFFHESFIDEMAHAADADPLTFRADLIRPAHAPSAQLLDTLRDMSGCPGD